MRKIVKQLFNTVLLGALALVVFAPAGQATILAPGTCAGVGCVPATYTDFTTAGIFGALIMADTGSEAFAGKDVSNNTVFTGNFRQIVIKDTVTGNLDFLYQIQRTGGPDTIGRLSTIDFSSTIDDVGICTACSPGADLLAPAGSYVAPQFVSRGSAGDSIVFDFGGSSATQIGDTSQSNILVIKTNVNDYRPGSSSVIDGGVASVASFAPAPEPASAGLVLGALFGAGMLVARRFRGVKQ